MIQPELQSKRIFLVRLKIETENWSIAIFIIDFVLKTNPSTYKIKVTATGLEPTTT